MHPTALLVAAGVLGVFGVGLATRSDRVGTVARRPRGRDPLPVARGLAGVSFLLGIALLAVWLAV
jgi:hypothetical protein